MTRRRRSDRPPLSHSATATVVQLIVLLSAYFLVPSLSFCFCHLECPSPLTASYLSRKDRIFERPLGRDPSVLCRRAIRHYPQWSMGCRFARNGANFHEKSLNGANGASAPEESAALDVWIDGTCLARAFSDIDCASQKERYADVYVDVSAYSAAVDGVEDEIQPAFLRLRPDARNSGVAPVYSERLDECKLIDDRFKMGEIFRADQAAKTTLRWCDDFVSRLGLCPWAKQSLTTKRAVRIKVVPQELGVHVFEQAVRDASEELLRVTGQTGYEYNEEEDEGCCNEFVDPNVAITFVVASPPTFAYLDAATPAPSSSDLVDFDFVPFHDFTADLEDCFFVESLEYEQATTTVHLADEMPRVGDLVTIAPFHPQWQFAAADNDEDDDSVAWEKRAPFPTVSLVLTSAIRAAGEEVTERIGIHNENVLNNLGSHALRGMFRERVLLEGKHEGVGQ